MNLYPLLPLRDIVVFPGSVVPLFVGREKSVAALEEAMAGSKDILEGNPHLSAVYQKNLIREGALRSCAFFRQKRRRP